VHRNNETLSIEYKPDLE